MTARRTSGIPLSTARRLRDLIAAGMTREEAAEACGVHVNTAERYGRGLPRGAARRRSRPWSDHVPDTWRDEHERRIAAEAERVQGELRRREGRN